MATANIAINISECVIISQREQVTKKKIVETHIRIGGRNKHSLIARIPASRLTQQSVILKSICLRIYQLSGPPPVTFFGDFFYFYRLFNTKKFLCQLENAVYYYSFTSGIKLSSFPVLFVFSCIYRVVLNQFFTAIAVFITVIAT